MHKLRPVSGLFFIVVSTLVACASTSSEESEGGGAAVNDGSHCTAAARATASSHLKKAIQSANSRLRGAVCDDEDGMDPTVMGIASEAHAAVEACGDVTRTIGTSEEAKPIREALKGNVALALFDGRLEMASSSDGHVTMNGLGKVLEAGVTLWGPTPGVYGNTSKIWFGPGNQGVLSRLDVEASPEVWNDVAVRYEVGDTNSRGTKITVKISAVGSVGKSSETSTVYRLAPGSDPSFDVRMSPEDPSSEEFFTAMPSECEA